MHSKMQWSVATSLKAFFTFISFLMENRFKTLILCCEIITETHPESRTAISKAGIKVNLKRHGEFHGKEKHSTNEKGGSRD